MKEGEGTFEWANGDVYEGKWKNNQIIGIGKMSFNEKNMK